MSSGTYDDVGPAPFLARRDELTMRAVQAWARNGAHELIIRVTRTGVEVRVKGDPRVYVGETLDAALRVAMQCRP